MKIALIQLNYHIGHFSYNRDKIIKAIQQAETAGVDLAVFSELCVCGYPPQDLLDYTDFIRKCEQTVTEIADCCRTTAAVIGTPMFNKENRGKKLVNAACFLSKGRINYIQPKTLLPTYDIFDEYRYFASNKKFNCFNFHGYKIGLTICEDFWDELPVETFFHRTNLYKISPLQELIKTKPDLIINIAASPFSHNRINNKLKVFTSKAAQHSVPVIYVNQIGAQTGVVFEGASMAIDDRGSIVYKLHSFREDTRFIDFKNLKNNSLPDLYPAGINHISFIYEALLLGLQDFFRKLDFSRAVVGLSGGIDSAVVLTLAVKALGAQNVHALLMPSKYSSSHSVSDSKQLITNLKTSSDTLPINSIVNAFHKTLAPLFKKSREDITEENIQARTRGVLLMAYANKFDYILLNTSNKSEAAVGYTTLYGDMNGALSVLGDVYKTDVYKLASYINREQNIIPENILKKAPSAELKPGQQDSHSLPPYNILDRILYQYIEMQKPGAEIRSMGFDKDLVNKVISLVNYSEYKRYQAPPALRVSTKAFGPGRRMPLVARY